MARGRRVNSSGEKSKQLLLEKAIELFSTHGYHQTKISDIVQAANLTQPTFYLYFQSKESLFNDLNAAFQSRLYEICDVDLVAVEGHDKTVREKILENLKQIFYYFLENPNLTKIGFYNSPEAGRIKSELATRIMNVLDNQKGQFLALNQVKTRTLAESLVGSIERLTLTYLLTNDANPEQLAEDIANIYFVEEKSLVM